MMAVVEAYRCGLFHPRHWLKNLSAGLTVGIVALPLAMAFAIASGAKPEQGLYTAIVAGFIVGIFGGSRTQIAGPTGAFVVILSGVTARYGIEGLQIATLMAGGILVLMGTVKLGNLIKFIPDPVIVGFTAGIAIIIFVGAWKDFLGLSIQIPPLARFHEKIWILFRALPHLDLKTTFLGTVSLSLVLLTPYIKWIKHIPGPLIALVAVTSIQAIFHFPSVVTIGDMFGGIPDTLPSLSLPTFSLNHFLDLAGPAFTIALLGAIESLLSAVVADGMSNTRHRPNQELIGQGIANILCPLLGGFAATGAIARTATNIRNGANSPLASIIHSVTLVAVILFLAPLATYIPLCTLAAILFVVAYNMSDLHHFIFMVKHAPRHDILVLLITFGLTIFTDLVVAINVGVLLAVLLFVQRMSQSVHIDLEDTTTLYPELYANGLPSLPKDVLVYSIQGPFFFGAAETLEHTLAMSHMDPRVVVFRLKHVPFMDMTGLQTFYDLIEQFHRRGVLVYLCEVRPTVSQKLIKVHILQWVQGHQFYKNLADVIKNIC